MVLVLYLYEKLYKIGYILLYSFWRAWLSFEGIDQKVIWGVLVIILFFVFILRNLLNPQGDKNINVYDCAPVNDNRLQTWISSIKPVLKNRNSYYSKWALARDFYTLVAATLSEHLGIDAAKAQDIIMKRDFEAPQEIHDYLQAGGNSLTEIKIEPFFLRLFRSTPLDLNPERVIQYLEKQYGNDH
jgi:hypothetical protein